MGQYHDFDGSGLARRRLVYVNCTETTKIVKTGFYSRLTSEGGDLAIYSEREPASSTVDCHIKRACDFHFVWA